MHINILKIVGVPWWLSGLRVQHCCCCGAEFFLGGGGEGEIDSFIALPGKEGHSRLMP